VILVDTGPLVAAADLDDADHRVCVELFASTPGPLIGPALIVAEVCYLLGQHAGSVGRQRPVARWPQAK